MALQQIKYQSLTLWYHVSLSGVYVQIICNRFCDLSLKVHFWTSVNIVIYLTVMEKVNLLKHPAPAVGGHSLVDDLHRVLHLSKKPVTHCTLVHSLSAPHLGVDVDAGLDTGVGPLAQHLPCQPVQLLERVGGQRGRAGCLLLLPAPGFGLFFTSCYCWCPFIFFDCKENIQIKVV